MSENAKKTKKELMREYRERKETGGVYAIRNVSTGKTLILSTGSIEKAPNLFEFSRMTGSCVHPALADDWAAQGPDAFRLEILETLDRKETQNPEEFRDDIRALEELWKEKYQNEDLYR